MSPSAASGGQRFERRRAALAALIERVDGRGRSARQIGGVNDWGDAAAAPAMRVDGALFGAFGKIGAQPVRDAWAEAHQAPAAIMLVGNTL